MKKKIEQLLNGKFEYEQPQLLFSKEKISLTMKAGETKRGEVYVGTEDNQKIRGYVTSSSRRVVPGMDHISGTTVLPLGIDTVDFGSRRKSEGMAVFYYNIERPVFLLKLRSRRGNSQFFRCGRESG